MTRALFLRLLTIAAVTFAICLIPEFSFAQHGGGHGGGGGFHGGGAGFHGGGFGGSFHGGGGFHGGGFGGFNGGGFHHGFGFPNRFGRGWGGWGWGGSGWGGWGWGWAGWGGWGWGLGWGWPGWYGYPYYGSWGPNAYGCPNYAYPSSGYCDPNRYSPSDDPGNVDPPSNGPGNYPQGNNSEPDWRHEADPNRQPKNVQPDQSQPEPSHSPGSVSTPNSKLIIVKYVHRPTSKERTLRFESHDYFEGSSSEQVLPKFRPSVRNAIILLRTMPPAARERWLASGRYSKFSPGEQLLIREYVRLSSE